MARKDFMNEITVAVRSYDVNLMNAKIEELSNEVGRLSELRKTRKNVPKREANALYQFGLAIGLLLGTKEMVENMNKGDSYNDYIG